MTEKHLKYQRIAVAAQSHGIPRSTLRSAVERGEIDSAVTDCGLKLVATDGIGPWIDATDTRRPGPKVSQKRRTTR